MPKPHLLRKRNFNQSQSMLFISQLKGQTKIQFNNLMGPCHNSGADDREGKYIPPRPGQILSNGEKPDTRNSKVVKKHFELTPQAKETFQRIKHKLTEIKGEIYEIYEPHATYQGEFENRLPHGYGHAYFENQSFYAGEFFQGNADTNFGIYIFPDGSLYEGGLKNSIFHGFGGKEDKKHKIKYLGDWVDGKPHGQGEEVYEASFKQQKTIGNNEADRGQKVMYIGQFEEGKKEGYGFLKTTKGFYEGNFQNGKINGLGSFLWNNDTLYIGKFEKNKLHGKGKLYFDQTVLTGEWNRDKRITLFSEENYDYLSALIQDIKGRKGKKISLAKKQWREKNQMKEDSEESVNEEQFNENANSRERRQNKQLTTVTQSGNADTLRTS